MLNFIFFKGKSENPRCLNSYEVNTSVDDVEFVKFQHESNEEAELVDYCNWRLANLKKDINRICDTNADVLNSLNILRNFMQTAARNYDFSKSLSNFEFIENEIVRYICRNQKFITK